MHPDNAFYGHDRILAAAAGLDHRTLRGQVQHGWSTTHGLGTRFRQVSWLPLLGWSDRTREEARAAGLPPVTLIGAPFTYLAAGVDRSAPRPRATIAYPFHSTERFGLTGSHERLAAELAEREQGPVTVCLYWADVTPEAVAAYEAQGFTVVNHGRRDDTAFLHRQLATLLAHDRLVTNRVGSALWYGAHLGLEVEIYGPRFTLANLTDVDARLGAFARSEWPELHEGPVSGAAAVELGDRELGAAHRRDRDELGAVLTRGGRLRRGTERALATVEHRGRQVAVRIVGRLPGGAGIDAPPMPSRLPATAAPDPVEGRPPAADHAA